MSPPFSVAIMYTHTHIAPKPHVTYTYTDIHVTPKPDQYSISISQQWQPIYYQIIEYFTGQLLPFSDIWLHLAWNYWLKAKHKKELDGIRPPRNKVAFYKHI